MTWDELLSLLSGKGAEDPDALVRELDARREELEAWIPRIRTMYGFDQKSRYHQHDLWIHTLHVAAGLPRGMDDPMLYLGALLHDIGKPMVQCRGKDPEDPYMHYYGHPQAGVGILENDILPGLVKRGVRLSAEKEKRLKFYVEHHDDQMSLKKKVLLRHLSDWGPDLFRNLMILEIVDASAHIVTEPIIAERLQICGEVLRWLDSPEIGKGGAKS